MESRYHIFVMIPSNLNNFLLATIGSSASFIGLLFVAMSFTLPGAASQEDAHRKQTLAEGSYIALINIFFISLVALVPGVQMGFVIVVMSLVGLISVYRSLQWHKRLLLASNAFTIVYSTVLYRRIGVWAADTLASAKCYRSFLFYDASYISFRHGLGASMGAYGRQKPQDLTQASRIHFWRPDCIITES